MKLYSTRAEAEANPEEDRKLVFAECGGIKLFGWERRANTATIIREVFKRCGGNAGTVDAGRGQYLRLSNLPKSQALAELDRLRREIEAKTE